MEKQVIIIYAGANGLLDDIPANKVVAFEADLYPFLEAKYPKILENISAKKALDKDIEAELNKALEEFKINFNQSTNQNNQSSYNGVPVKYVDDIPNEAIVVDFYDTRTERHEFEKYFYYEGTFYYDTGMNYRILNVNETKTGCKHVHMHDKNNKQVSLVITRFLQQYDLI